jgi:hypothetical protein
VETRKYILGKYTTTIQIIATPLPAVIADLGVSTHEYGARALCPFPKCGQLLATSSNRHETADDAVSIVQEKLRTHWKRKKHNKDEGLHLHRQHNRVQDRLSGERIG